jgi:4-amino-4-deoxy-L-arabinose transferase-like glycosyltransferase
LLVVVSLSWAVAVDLTPASQRPYVGSTSTNSEMELIFGYNGVDRLLGMMGGRMRPAAAQPQANFPALPGLGGWDGGGRQGGGGGMFNTGTPGALRFFQAPLAKEMSWLLPFALLVIMLGIAFGFMEGGGLRRFRLPLLSETHKALVLWGGWLLTCLVFFSIAGFFHNYYLATLSPALAALIGVGVYLLHQLAERNRLLAVLSLLVICAGTLVFQLYLVSLFGLYGVWAYLSLGFCGLALVVSIVAVLRKSAPQAVFNAAVMAALVGMLIIPGLWSFRTVASGTSGTLPEAYSGDHSNNRVFGNPGPGGAPGDGNFGDSANSALVSYLQENTQNIKYLVAVPSSHNGSDLVLETGRPVLFMGGFSGSDPVLDANGLARLVNQGELRYVMTGGQGGPGGSSNSDISNWVQNNCHLVDNLTQSSGGMRGGSTLYDCGS